MPKNIQPLSASTPFKRCESATLGFESTADLSALLQSSGQGRTLNALSFGGRMRTDGLNIFFMGPAHSGLRFGTSS